MTDIWLLEMHSPRKVGIRIKISLKFLPKGQIDTVVKCQRSNPEAYGWIHQLNPPVSDDITETKQTTKQNDVHILWDILGVINQPCSCQIFGSVVKIPIYSSLFLDDQVNSFLMVEW